MSLDELQNWILSNEGMKEEFTFLSRYSAAKSLGLQMLSPELMQYRPDWKRLLFAGSVLTKSASPISNEVALMLAHAGLYSDKPQVVDASAILLTQLANHRAIYLAKQRGVLSDGLEERLGASEQMLLARRELIQSVFPENGDTITTNRFQRQFWDDLEQASWVSASAPTASGKTYLVLQWLLNEFATHNCHLAIFLAPTRALVGEIERQLLELSLSYKIDGLRIASLPLSGLGDRSRPTILVFTQERLHVFLNFMREIPQIDITIVDEVHKLGDGLRGVILQDAIERVVRSNDRIRLVFLSPLTENPETLVADAPNSLITAVVSNEIPTVTQNLIIAEQKPRHSDLWRLLLRRNRKSEELGELKLHAKPDTDIKRLSYVSLALGKNHSGTLVYANGAAEAEKIAWQIFEGLTSEFGLATEVDSELKELSDFTRDIVHPKFQLVELLKRGVAFHYGNMPTLLRSEIERLFREGKIRFLVCTSTLVEGVNLACRTIVVRGPRKGQGTKMGPHDFWNLAGRAGRWGQDFHGNIVCVDVNRLDLWPQGIPERSRYPIKRETDVVLTQRQSMIDYLDGRLNLETASINPKYEQVTAYLLAWQVREGSFLSAPAASRITPEYAQQLDEKLSEILVSIDLNNEIISRHPGVSAVALQSLLKYFRSTKRSIEDLIPSSPDSDDAYERLIVVFSIINKYLFPAFLPNAAVPVYALVTVEWMRGLPLGQIISRRIAYLEERKRAYRLPAVIRDTMGDVEEIARFKAPKFLAAYLDVLKFYLDEIGQGELFPGDLRFDLFLEFGVATQTLLSLIGLGLSRTSAVAINEFLANDSLGEDEVHQWLAARDWDTIDVPRIVKHEIKRMLEWRVLSTAS